MTDEARRWVLDLFQRAVAQAAATLPDRKLAEQGLLCVYPTFELLLLCEVRDDLLITSQPARLLERAPVRGWITKQLQKKHGVKLARWRAEKIVFHSYDPFHAAKVCVELQEEKLMDWVEV